MKGNLYENKNTHHIKNFGFLLRNKKFKFFFKNDHPFYILLHHLNPASSALIVWKIQKYSSGIHCWWRNKKCFTKRPDFAYSAEICKLIVKSLVESFLCKRHLCRTISKKNNVLELLVEQQQQSM